MPRTEHPMDALRQYIPEGSFELVVHYIHHYKVHLTVTKARKSVLGDYRHPFMGKHHRISVNGNLNPYEFLITLLHELAHLLTFDKFGNKVEAHGAEWKSAYRMLLVTFVQHNIFPADILLALKKTIINPSATANGETELIAVLRKYDKPKAPGWMMVQDVPPGALFKTKDGRVFRKEVRLRKRFRGTEVSTGLKYLFSPVYEVLIVMEK